MSDKKDRDKNENTNNEQGNPLEKQQPYEVSSGNIPPPWNYSTQPDDSGMGSITRIISMLGLGGIPASSPIDDKITSEHIDKILDLNAKRMENERSESSETKKYVFWGSIILFASLLGFIIYLVASGNQSFAEKIVPGIIGLLTGGVGGGLTGYGIGIKNK